MKKKRQILLKYVSAFKTDNLLTSKSFEIKVR